MKRIGLNAVAVLLLLLSFGIMRGVGQSFEPENLGGRVNSAQSDVNPVFSKGGDTLFFARINEVPNKYLEEDSQDIWMSGNGRSVRGGTAARLPIA